MSTALMNGAEAGEHEAVSQTQMKPIPKQDRDIRSGLAAVGSKRGRWMFGTATDARIDTNPSAPLVARSVVIDLACREISRPPFPS